MFPKACEYGTKPTIYFAMQSEDDQRVSLKDIARASNAPEAFTAKILQILAKANVIDSVRGAAGGFEIDAAKLNTFKLSQIVSANDRDEIYKSWGLGCRNVPGHCPIGALQVLSHTRRTKGYARNNNSKIINPGFGSKPGLFNEGKFLIKVDNFIQ